MKHIKKYFLTGVLVFLLAGICFPDTEEDYNKTAFTGNDGANVRAGDNMNFESLCQLESSTPLKVIGKRYSWFKVELPKEAHLYIKNDYVEMVSEKGHGFVNAMDVNLRAGPGTNYSILGQVSKPDKLTIISEINGWYEIEPPEGTAGWIHSSQVRFSPEESDKDTRIIIEKKKASGTEQKKDTAPRASAASNIKLRGRMPLDPEVPKHQSNLRISAPKQ